MKIELDDNKSLSSATILTQDPQRIMNRLCKHWAHKLPVNRPDYIGDLIA